ncbi:MAG: hypothetical protein KDC05_16300 [Bacteroidales bacterium]|nr:hypothetical protein [Bacteroidales bacterium]
MRTSQLIIILTFITFCGFAQNNFNDRRFFKRGKIELKTGLSYKIKKVIISSDSVMYERLVTGDTEQYPHYFVESLKVQNGTKMLGGAAIGAGIIFIFTLEAMIDNQPNAKNAGLRWAGFIAGGAVVGGLIGYSIPSLKTWDFKNHQLLGLRMGVSHVYAQKFPTIGLSLNF